MSFAKLVDFLCEQIVPLLVSLSVAGELLSRLGLLGLLYECALAFEFPIPHQVVIICLEIAISELENGLGFKAKLLNEDGQHLHFNLAGHFLLLGLARCPFYLQLLRVSHRLANV